jgi:hypothetical protein
MADMAEEIVKWVHYDNKLKEYNEKSKRLREEKDKLSEKIFEYYDIDEHKQNSELPKFNLTKLKTKLTVHQSNHYESLNYKFLTKCLCEHFGNQEQADELVEFIRNKRSHETKISLKRESTA